MTTWVAIAIATMAVFLIGQLFSRHGRRVDLSDARRWPKPKGSWRIHG